MSKRIVQIAATPAVPDTMPPTLYALCSDGTVWSLKAYVRTPAWEQVQPIGPPGSDGPCFAAGNKWEDRAGIPGVGILTRAQRERVQTLNALAYDVLKVSEKAEHLDTGEAVHVLEQVGRTCTALLGEQA